MTWDAPATSGARVIRRTGPAPANRLNSSGSGGRISSGFCAPGNRGLTCVGIIETSHIALHCWDEDDPGLFQLDVYSCKDFDPMAVVEHFGCFEPVKVEYKFLDREFELVELPINEPAITGW